MEKVQRDLLVGWSVLIIEDMPDNLDIAQTLLEEYGATVYTATNGAEGLEVLQQIKPNFVLSDISMPIMDGWDFIATVKKDRGLADIPVIALTAHAMTGDRARAMAAGFHNYMTKPFTISTFVNDLMRILVDVPEFDRTLHFSVT